MSVLATEAEARASVEAPAVLDQPGLAGGQRRWQAIAAMVVPMAACMALLGLGYLVGGGGRPAQAPGVPGQVPLAGAPRLTSAGVPSLPGPAPVGGPPLRPAAIRPHASAFMVTDTNTQYRKSTLPTQVRHRLAAERGVPGRQPADTVSAPVPATGSGDGVPNSRPATAASTPGGGATTEVAPSKSLVACVLHVTGNVPPKFVDRGTYQAKPVYVIAVSDEAWVVGVDCTPARPAVITSVRLANSG